MLSGLFKKKPVEAHPPVAATQQTQAKPSSAAASAERISAERGDLESLHKEDIPYKGDPENQVLVWDLDETLLFGDVYKRDLRKESVRKDIEAQGYEIKQTQQGRYYVLRPGAEEILKGRYEMGHKNVVVSRDLTPYLRDIF